MPVLEIEKNFDCSREELYAAWTVPDQLKQWWKPLGKQLVDVKNDLNEGGVVQYRFDGDSLTIDGTYQKVVAEELLEYSWNWHSAEQSIHDTAYRLSVRFGGEANNARISIKQEGFDSEESIQPHQHGWEQGLEQLKSYLQSRSSQPGTSAAQQRPPVSGYNETPGQEKAGGG